MTSNPKATPRILSAGATRARLDEVLRRVKSDKERFLIEQSGEPQAVILSFEDYMDLIAPAPDTRTRLAQGRLESGRRKGRRSHDHGRD